MGPWLYEWTIGDTIDIKGNKFVKGGKSLLQLTGNLMTAPTDSDIKFLPKLPKLSLKK